MTSWLPPDLGWNYSWHSREFSGRMRTPRTSVQPGDFRSNSFQFQPYSFEGAKAYPQPFQQHDFGHRSWDPPRATSAPRPRSYKPTIPIPPPENPHISSYSRQLDDVEDRIVRLRAERHALQNLTLSRSRSQSLLRGGQSAPAGKCPQLPPQRPSISQAALPEIIYIGSTITPLISYHPWGCDTNGTSFNHEWFLVDYSGRETMIGNSAWQYIDEGALGKLVKLHITSTCGDDLVVLSRHLVVGKLPSIHHLIILGEPKEGETLTLSYDCAGGLRVRPYVAWFRGSTEIPEAQNCLSYTTVAQDCYQQILVEVTPVLEDGSLGATVSACTPMIEPLDTAPDALELTISGAMLVGGNLRAVVSSPRTARDHHQKPKVRWFRISKHGDVRLPNEPDGSYTLTTDDVGHFIKVEFTPRRADGGFGLPAVAMSESQCYEERKARIAIARLAWQTEAHYSEPVEGDTLVLQIITDDVQLKNIPPQVRWFRNGFFMQEGPSLAFQLGRSEVGCRVMAECKVKGSWGHWQQSLESGQVLPGQPEVISAFIMGDFRIGGRVTLQRQVKRGDGAGSIVWYRVDPEMNDMVEVGSGEPFLDLAEEDFECLICVDYTPHSLNDLHCETFRVTSNERVKAGIPVVMSCRLEGRPVVGHELAALVEVNYNGPAGNDTIAWYRGGVEAQRYSLREPHSTQYQCTEKDIGFNISFEYTPVNRDGVTGRMVSVATAEPVRPSPPTLLQNVFVGRKMKAPFDAPDGRHRLVTWFKTRDGVEWAKICETDEESVDPERMDDLYCCMATADFLNLGVKCELTLAAADGTVTQKVETPPAVVQLLPEFREKLEMFLVAGMQAMDIRVGVIPAALVLDFKQILVLTNGKKLEGAKWNTNGAFIPDPEQANKFTLRLSKDKELECSLAEASHRDMTALVFRCFMAMGIREIAERVVGQQAALDWRKGRYLNNRMGGRLLLHPEYSTEQSTLRYVSNIDQLNRSVILSADTSLTPAERAEQEIFICRYGLPYWLARLTLEHVLTPAPLLPRSPPPAPT
eukprot:GGOE01014847.1.p1 GENE.GGOE01014847.1~~GGOE01014847.1.p1  ORF type:complete len:1035 (+),score=223.80 GGOE01014847.1:27-3131(+)